jgi:plasmid stability protein
MAAVTVHNLSEETQRALERRAASKGISTEAEIRFILEEAVRSPAAFDTRIKIGTELADFARQYGGLDLNIARDRTPSKPVQFE